MIIVIRAPPPPSLPVPTAPPVAAGSLYTSTSIRNQRLLAGANASADSQSEVLDALGSLVDWEDEEEDEEEDESMATGQEAASEMLTYELRVRIESPTALLMHLLCQQAEGDRVSLCNHRKQK